MFVPFVPSYSLLSFFFLRTVHATIRQGDKARQSNYTQRQLFNFQKKMSCLGRDSSRNTLHTVQMLYQLSHRGSSAGQAESLKVMQVQRCLSPDGHGNSNSVLSGVSRGDETTKERHDVPMYSAVSPLYSGHSVKQPPHYYSHLLRSLVVQYICTSIKQPPLYCSHKCMAHGQPL